MDSPSKGRLGKMAFVLCMEESLTWTVLLEHHTSINLTFLSIRIRDKNFESTLLRQTLETFGNRKSRTTAYHPQGDGMVERWSLLQMLRAYVKEKANWERFLPLPLSCLHIGQRSIHPQEFLHFNLCLADHYRLHQFPKQLPMNRTLTMLSY